MDYTSQKYHCSVRNVAMVCVAAVAVGSSTYAWFVSNNNVDAITTDISAQSNSAYLVIQEATADKIATDNTSTSSATAKDRTAVALYPAQVINGTAAGSYKFESAYHTPRLWRGVYAKEQKITSTFWHVKTAR